MNESDVYVRYNTALMEQQATERRLKLQELSATLECARNARGGMDGRWAVVGYRADQIEQAANKLIDELFPQSPETQPGESNV